MDKTQILESIESAVAGRGYNVSGDDLSKILSGMVGLIGGGNDTITVEGVFNENEFTPSAGQISFEEAYEAYVSGKTVFLTGIGNLPSGLESEHRAKVIDFTYMYTSPEISCFVYVIFDGNFDDDNNFEFGFWKHAA